MTEFSDVLTDDLPEDYNLSREFEATIDIDPTAKPISLRPYRLPLFLENELQRTLEYLLARKIIEPSDSPFGFPVLFSRRKNDPRSPTDPSSYRMCLDLRKLHALVISNSTFPTPNPDEMLESVASLIRDSNAQNYPPDHQLWMSALDLLRGFWQIPVKATDRKYVAIVTKFGKYSFRSLPFGYKHASEIFQHWITLLFQDIPGVKCYIDDVLLLSFGTFEQHCALIRRVLLRCREQRVYLKKSKAQFFQKTVEFLGHRVSADGIATQHSKTAAILDWSPPTNVKQLKTFLGLSSYYRKFVRGYAHLAAPLHQLLRKDVPFVWSSDCDQAFQELKQRLTTSPVLSHFDPLLRTEIQTNSSYRHFHIDNGLLLLTDSLARRRICIPQSLRKELLYRSHDLHSHRGFSRTYLDLVPPVYWPAMRQQIERYVLSCQSCLQYKSYRKPQMGISHSHRAPSDRFSTVSIDVVSGFPPTTTKFDSIFVCTDDFSGRIFLSPCKKTLTSQQAADLFVAKVCANQGIPNEIISDNAKIFSSAFWTKLFQILQVKFKHSSPYYPQSNGRPGRLNSVLIEALRIYCANRVKHDWDRFLPLFELHYNSSVKRSTGLAPFEIIYGRNVKTQLALPDLSAVSNDPEDIREAIQVHLEAARDAMDHLARSTEQQLDQSRRPHSFQVDDLVWLSTANIPVSDSFPKLRPRFIGPFKILSFISDNTVRLELTDRFRHLEHGTFNIKWLRPHQDRDPNFELSVDRPAPLDTAQGLEYEVEQILAKRRHGRGIQYLVHWK
eukprot:246445-Hanusia_phi.AAC.1